MLEGEFPLMDLVGIAVGHVYYVLYSAKVIKVYDGDTITCALDFGLGIVQLSVRLDGIDTPEIRGSGPNEKEFATNTRDFLRDVILYELITLNCNGMDKYGRLLGTVYHNDENINNLLISKGFAYEYDGGTKKGFEHLDE